MGRPTRPVDKNAAMRVTAKVDYAMRAAIVLARADAAGEGHVKGDQIGKAQGIPVKFLENILAELRQAGIVRSQRGADGGYWLARPAKEISMADIIRAVEGPLANVRGERPEDLEYADGTGSLQLAWIATRAGLRRVLDNVTLADLVGESLPRNVARLTEDEGAWGPR